MLDLSSKIHAALPWLTFRTLAVVDALLLSCGPVGTAQRLAAHLGLRSRFQLAALLRDEGLPSLHRLSGWMTVLHWTWDSGHSEVSLSSAALRMGREPAACYRLVKRITGVPWSGVRAAGWDWALSKFLEECTTRPRKLEFAQRDKAIAQRPGAGAFPPRAANESAAVGYPRARATDASYR